MQRCPICNGRTVSKPEGVMCMSSACEGSKAPIGGDDNALMCKKCDQKMQYQGLNSWGEPNYVCVACGTTVKL